MPVKATVGGVPVEVWFTPSFNIKTTDKRLEQLLRVAKVETFDPWRKQVRTVKATRSLRETYLVLEEYRLRVPEMKIEIEEHPEVPKNTDKGTDEEPVLD